MSDRGQTATINKSRCIYLSYQRGGLSLGEIGDYFGVQRSAVSQLSGRFAGSIEGNRELGMVLDRVEKEGFVECCGRSDPSGFILSQIR